MIRRAISALAATALVGLAAPAKDPTPIIPDPGGDLVLPRDVALNAAIGYGPDDMAPGTPSRIRLFRMPTGFLSDPVGIIDDDAVSGDDAAGDVVNDPRLGLVLGTDNPFFDFRSPGDPGGVGYYKVNTQYQLMDSRRTCLSFAFQAATPAGLDSFGVAGGPTVIDPALAWYHELENGLAFQGFVAKSLAARAHWSDNLERSVRYGVAVQSPLPGTAASSPGSVHMFVEALGYSRLVEDTPGPREWASWQLLPGLHWQVRENWWLSGGLIVPLQGSYRFDPDFWQITCSWRF
jgi:hypothetical protein